MINKEDVRAEFLVAGAAAGGAGEPGRIAELVRRLPGYRQAGRLFVTPAVILKQVRINSLLDGKELLMPAPGLKEGFFLLKPYSIPFRDLAYAVSSKGLAQHGSKAGEEELRRQPVGLLFTEVVAADRSGGFVGDGKGFFDLTVALLAELGALTPEAEAFGALAGEGQILAEPLALAAWDVRLNGLLTKEAVVGCSEERPAARRLLWEALPPKRIRKISPLYKLSQR